MFAYLPELICILGLLIYLLVDPTLRGGRVLEMGRLMFWVGLFVSLLVGVRHL